MKYTEIKWRDIASVSEWNCEWFTAEDALKASQALYEVEYASIGVIIAENNEFIVIASTIDPLNQSYSDISMIPKVNIITRKDIKGIKRLSTREINK